MVDCSGEAGLVFESGHSGFIDRVIFVEDFDGDFAIESIVLSYEDDTHAADGVAALQCVAAKCALDFGFGFAFGADRRFERPEGRDVEQLFTPGTGVELGYGLFRRAHAGVDTARRLPSFQNSAERSTTLAFDGNVPGHIAI